MEPPLGQLEEPPIIEVVCGVSFEPMPGLDPISLGAFWKSKEAQFPRREFKLPISAAPEAMELALGPDIGPIRTWLVSRDDVLIVQVQHDRFYLNWRAREQEYPRFNDRDGQQGLLSQFMEHWRDFTDFCVRELGGRVAVHAVELAKIDHLVRGRHWNAANDLAELVPMLKGALEFSDAEPAIAVRVSSRRGDDESDIGINSLLKKTGTPPPVPVVKIESRRIAGVSRADEVRARLQGANVELNALFVRLIPRDQHHRFRKGWRPA